MPEYRRSGSPKPEMLLPHLKEALKEGARAESLTSSELVPLTALPEDSVDLTPFERAKLTERRIREAIKALGGERETYLMIVYRLDPATPQTLEQRYAEAGRIALSGRSAKTARQKKYRDSFLTALAMQLNEMLSGASAADSF
jgi:hypothetical protein